MMSIIHSLGAGPDGRLPVAALTTEEAKLFERAWKSFGYPDRFKSHARTMVENYKLKTDRPFQWPICGSGFTIRLILPEDLMIKQSTFHFEHHQKGREAEQIVWLHSGLVGGEWNAYRSMRNVDCNNATEVWYTGVIGFQDASMESSIDESEPTQIVEKGDVNITINVTDSVVMGDGISVTNPEAMMSLKDEVALMMPPPEKPQVQQIRKDSPVRGVLFNLHGAGDFGEMLIRPQLRETGKAWLDACIALMYAPYAVGLVVDRSGRIYLEPLGWTVCSSIRSKYFPLSRPTV